MPTRLLKESICDSDSIDKLTWFEEVLFYRLIVSCDDYGRFDGRTAVIKNRLFPLKDTLTLKQVDAAVTALATYGLLTLYSYEGKRFVALPGWDRHQQVRAKRSKYPAPEDGEIASDIICKQMISNDIICPRNPIQSNPIQSNPNTNPAQERIVISDLDKAIKEFVEFRRKAKHPMTDRAVDMLRSKLDKLGKTDAERIKIIEQSIYRGWTDVYPIGGDKDPAKGKHAVYHDSRESSVDEDQLLRELSLDG